MRYAIILFAFLIGGCEKADRYQIVAAKGSTPEEDRAWVLNSETGKVSLCYEHLAEVKCLRQSKEQLPALKP